MSIGKIIKVAGIAAIVGTFAVVTFIVSTEKIDLSKLRGYVIVSGSMVPKIPLGSVVIVKPEASYSPGDIVSFKTKSDSGSIPTTHRLVRDLGKNANSKQVFETKGDVNNSSDLDPISEDEIIGKVFITVPYLGYLATAARTQKGYIFLIIVPSTIVIYEELKVLFGSLHRFIKSTFGKKSPPANLLLFITFIFGSTFFIPISRSFYSDTVVSGVSTFATKPDFGLIQLDFYSPDGKSVGFKLSGDSLSNYSGVSYLITYDSDMGQQGIVGEVSVSSDELEVSGLGLGTCSGEDCVLSSGIKNLKLNLVFEGEPSLVMEKVISSLP